MFPSIHRRTTHCTGVMPPVQPSTLSQVSHRVIKIREKETPKLPWEILKKFQTKMHAQETAQLTVIFPCSSLKVHIYGLHFIHIIITEQLQEKTCVIDMADVIRHPDNCAVNHPLEDLSARHLKVGQTFKPLHLVSSAFMTFSFHWCKRPHSEHTIIFMVPPFLAATS